MMRYAHVVSRHSHRHQIRHRTTMHRQIMQHIRHSLTDSRRATHRDSNMNSIISRFIKLGKRGTYDA